LKPSKFYGIADYALDPESAARLWEISSKLLGLEPLGQN